MLNAKRLSISAIGKIKKTWIKEGIKEYKNRIPELTINEYKTFDLQNLKNQTSNKIIISLSEEGKIYNSSDFSSLLLNFKIKRFYSL